MSESYVQLGPVSFCKIVNMKVTWFSKKKKFSLSLAIKFYYIHSVHNTDVEDKAKLT